VKNQETVKILIWKQYYELIDEEGGWRYWNPDPTKLYDIPKDWKVEIIDNSFHQEEKVAILIPEE